MIYRTPDGQLANFPDSMSEAQVEDALRKIYSTPATSSQPAAAAPTGGFARSLVGAAAGAIGGLPGTLESLGNRFLPNAMTRPVTSFFDSSVPTTPQHLFPNPQEIEKAVGGREPDGAAERLALGVTRGVAGAIPFALLGPAGPTLAAGASGGLAAGGAEELGASPLVAAGAGALGGLAGGGIASVASRLQAARSADQAVRSATEALESARQVSVGAKASGEAHVQDITQHADATVEGIAAAHGTSQTMQEAGQHLQEGARDWLTNVMPQKQTAAWAPVDAAIPGPTPSPLGGFYNALEQIAGPKGALDPLTSLLSPKLPQQLRETFRDVLDGQPGDFTWADSRRLRSLLGEAMTNPQIIRDTGEKNLSRLYAAATSDMRQTAQGMGAAPLFDSANAESQRLYDIAQGPIAKVISGPSASLANDPAPEVAASRLLAGGKKGSTDLAALAQEIPGAQGELAGAALRGGLWGKLSPEARQTLVPDQTHQEVLDSATGASAEAREFAKGQTTSAREGFAQARQALEDAKTHQASFGPTVGDKVDAERHVVQSLLGVDIGRDLGEALKGGAAGLGLGHLVPGSSPALLGLAGATLPYFARGAAGALRQPNRLVWPAVGGLAAQNP
jgi:hypothetical protein